MSISFMGNKRFSHGSNLSQVQITDAILKNGPWQRALGIANETIADMRQDGNPSLLEVGSDVVSPNTNRTITLVAQEGNLYKFAITEPGENTLYRTWLDAENDGIINKGDTIAKTDGNWELFSNASEDEVRSAFLNFPTE